MRYLGSASTMASVYFPSAGRGKYWFGDKLLPYPSRKPSNFTLGCGRRNFRKMESLVVLMWTLRFGFLPFGNLNAAPGLQDPHQHHSPCEVANATCSPAWGVYFSVEVLH